MDEYSKRQNNNNKHNTIDLNRFHTSNLGNS